MTLLTIAAIKSGQITGCGQVYLGKYGLGSSEIRVFIVIYNGIRTKKLANNNVACGQTTYN